MPLITNEFQEITIKPSTDPAWAALSPPPSLPSFIVDKMVTGDPFVVYVVDAATGWLAYEGGVVFGLVDSVLASVSAALSMTTITDTAGNVTRWGQDGTAYIYGGASGFLSRLAATQVATLKAFLP